MKARHDTKFSGHKRSKPFDIPNWRLDNVDWMYVVEPLQFTQHPCRVSPDMRRHFEIAGRGVFVAIFDEPVHPHTMFEIDCVWCTSRSSARQNVDVVPASGQSLRQVVRQPPDSAHHAWRVLLA